MNFLDYIINLSIFSLLVSTPLVIRSFISHKPLKQLKIWVGLYGGLVTIILVSLSFQLNGYTYDIRYAPIILVFAYLGPVAGYLTAGFALVARLAVSGNWMPAIVGWSLMMLSFSVVHYYFKHRSPIKKGVILVGVYCVIYIITVPIIFNIFSDKPILHIQYLLFIILGVVIGGLLIESYERLYRMITEKNIMKQTMEDSESKYRLIAENTSDLIMVLDKINSISYLSPSHEQVLGFMESELKQIELCKLIHPEDIGMFRERIQEMFNQMKSKSMEYRFFHKQGYWLDFESRCMPVVGSNQEIEYIVIISRDISERKRAEEILLQSEKLSVVGELAAGVAHEIRNPLTTIKGFLQLYKNNNIYEEYNDLLLSELERIETITSEMLSLGKPQAIQLNRVNMNDLVEYTLDLLLPQAHLNGIQFNFSFEEPEYMITCEKNQIKQVFLNVLKNAIESMHNGGEISIHIQKNEVGECVVAFQDQGCGIPEELLPRLGEPFYSLKEKGTGLGLMICHKIIKQHNGDIIYRSKVNKGTLVEIKLPLSD